MRSLKLIKIILLNLLFSSYIFSADLANDQFTTGLNGWGGNSISWYGSDWMYIPRDKTASKTFDFGTSYANKNIYIEIAYWVPTSWESSGSYRDYIRVYNNTNEIYNETNGGGYRIITDIETTLDSNGKITLKIMADSTANNEDMYVDYVIIRDKSRKNIRDFTQIYTKNLFGDLIVIGNQLLCQNDYDGDTCESPTIGATNNSIDQHKVRIDTSTGSPSNNSMARLDLQPGDKIIWAGLYWSARIVSSSLDHPGADEIYMKVPGSSTYKKYTSMPEKYNWYSDGFVFDYACMQEVTEDVKAAGAGEYYVGGIVASNGSNRFASWALIVVVENPSRDYKNVNIYDGFQAVYSGAGYPDEVTVTASGFLTPRYGDVNSTLIVYTGESESGLIDYARVTDSSGTQHSLVDAYNNPNDVFNASISTNGVFRSDYRLTDPTLAKPNFQNVVGTDIDTLNINFFDNLQTSTEITIGSGGDRYTLNMFAISTELYTPKLCYDYTYGQSGYFQTAPSVKPARIEGTFDTSTPVNVKLYFKNLEQSDISLSNLELHIVDINSSQATYKRDTTYITPPSSGSQTFVPDLGRDVADEYDKNISIGSTLNALEYFYTYYSLDPKTTDINMSLNAIITYNLVFDTGTEVITLDNAAVSLADMNPCQNNSFYQPVPGMFNIVHNSYYNSSANDYYFNLPTQIVNRYIDNEYVIEQMDPDTDFEDVASNPVLTAVALEMIDASGFHYADATCTDVNTSTIGSRQWFIYENSSSAFLPISGTDLQNGGFFNKASRNAAFRLAYNSADSNGSAIKINITNGSYNLENYSGSCSECVSNMDKSQLISCMECIYTDNKVQMCSRDNFAIKPDAFNIAIKDSTNLVPQGVTRQNIAAGYDYTIEVNATTYTSSNSANGYTKTIDPSTISDGDIFSFKWDSNLTSSVCNDVDDKDKTVDFSNGFASESIKVSQVGDYKLILRDKTWTTIDSDPNLMLHHKVSGAYFIDNTSTNMVDCNPGSSSPYSPSASGLVECDIKSEYTNTNIPKTYYDYRLSIRPYKIVSSLIPGVGTASESLSSKNFVYNANLDKNDSGVYENFDMAYHLDGTVSAQGKDNTILSNFVDGCYAKDIQLYTTRTNYADTNMTLTQAIQAVDNAGNNLYISFNDVNNTLNNITLPTSAFIKPQNGLANVRYRYNFKRDMTDAKEPQTITFNKLHTNCFNVNECQSYADGNVTNEAYTSNDINNTVWFLYAKSYAPRTIINGDEGDVPIEYDIYCTTNCSSISGLEATIDPRWWKNTQHNSNYGKADTKAPIVQRSGAGVVNVVSGYEPTGNANDSVRLNYSGSYYPYKTTMQMFSDDWLIYNKYKSTDVSGNAINYNEFEVQFHNNNAGWVGSGESNNTTQKDTDEVKRVLTW